MKTMTRLCRTALLGVSLTLLASGLHVHRPSAGGQSRSLQLP